MKNTVRRLLAGFVALLMVLSLSGSVLALEAPEKIDRPVEAKPTASYDLSGIRNGKTFAITEKADDEIAADQIVTIMVELEDAPAMKVYSQYKSATKYAASLREKQAVAVKSISKALNFDIDVIYDYTLLFNGFSFKGEYRLVEELNKMEGINAFVAAEWDCPEIRLFNSGDMVGAIDAWDLDYTGEGSIVAIVDTGLAVSHPAFSNNPDPETAHFAKSDIAEIIASGALQGTGAATMNANNVYYSGKVPFRWNYVKRNNNVTHNYNDHGTHVAGIAAGNGGEIQGIAKDAQIAAMQVFNDGGGAGWEAILAALEDCVVLGVDAANLSLGSPCGFTHYYSASYEATFENLVNAGVNLAMSAGNEYSTALGNAWASSSTSIGYALNFNPDYGVTGSPSTWPRSLGVASVDNTKSLALYLQDVETGEMYAYTENSENIAKMGETLGGQTVEYVAVPGYGAPEDYEGIDVADKIALVSRGDITFVEKGQNAQANGAIAVIIYNNVEGSINMATDPSITIPYVFVVKEVGDMMAAQGTGLVYVAAEPAIVDAMGGGLPSEFSSWGTTSDLKIKPEITAPGGNIYSSTDPRPSMSGTLYQAWSGTSMSAPHVAGGMAIVTQYVNDMFPDASTAEKQNLVDILLMSTANPVADSDGSFASVRKQGAGLMDLADAVSTTSYITVPGCARPKLELGDDPEMTGVYEMTFVVNNFGDEDLTYIIDPYVLMDDLTAIAVTPDGEYVIARTQTSWDITDYCDIEMPDVVTVPAGGTKEVKITVTVIDELLAYIDTYYPVGNYIEGFIELIAQSGIRGDVNGDGQVDTADALAVMRHCLGIATLEEIGAGDVNGDGQISMADALLIMRYALEISNDFNLGEFKAGADLNVPFLAYYGDWNYAPMFDVGFYYDDFSMGSNPEDNFIGSYYGSGAYGLGVNPYIDTEDLSYYLADRNAISPNDDGFLDTADAIRLGLFRNADEAGYQLLDSEGNVLAQLAQQYDVRKSYYSTSNSSYSNLGSEMGLPKWNAAPFAGQDVAIRAYAYLSNDGSTTTEPFTEDSENMFNEWIIPIYVDVNAPTLEFVSFKDGVLTLKVTDEHYAAYVGAFEADVVEGEVSLSSLIDEVGLFEEERGMTTKVVLNDVTVGALICAADYAGNEIAYTFNGSALVPVADSWSHGSVNVPDVSFYGYGKNLNSKTWVKFSSGDMENLSYGGGIQSDNSDYTCGTYADGYVYACDSNSNLVRYDASDIDDWTSKTTIGKMQADYGFYEMAYDRSTDTLYAVSGLFDIYKVDVNTAELTYVSEAQYGLVAFDFDKDGTCYVVDVFGYLTLFDVKTGKELGDICNTGINAVDLNTGNFIPQCGTFRDGYFFWVAAPADITYYSQIHIYAIKVATGDYTDLGAVMGGLYTLCLFAYTVEIPEATVDPVDFYDNFEGNFVWETTDADGDGYTWGAEYFQQGLYQDGSKCAVSYSYLSGPGVLHPDNWMVSPEFEVGEGEKYLSFFTSTANPMSGDIYEHYAIYVIPEGGTIDDGILVYETTMDTNVVTEHVVDLSDFAGETISLAFRHYDCFDQYTLIVDSVGVGDMK